MQGQGLIVNEFSNGPGAEIAQEYIELLVVGSAADPTGLVDVTGWIIDDNNGDFTGGTGGAEINTGHIRLRGNCFNLLPPGTLIVIYNEVNPTPGLVDDPMDMNGDSVIVIPGDSPCLQLCITTPNAGTTTYACPFYANGGFYGRIEGDGDNDALQVRDPLGNFYHGFAYGALNTFAVSFPPPSGAAPFNLGAGGPGSYFGFGCGDYTTASNFFRAVNANDTPGAPNNPSNAATIREIRAGRFDYLNLQNPDNCGTILASPEIVLQGERRATGISLQWTLPPEANLNRFQLERRQVGQGFAPIFSGVPFPGQKQAAFLDRQAPAEKVAYRLRAGTTQGATYLSEVLWLSPGSRPLGLGPVYPNPGSSHLNLSLQIEHPQHVQVSLLDMLGKEVLRQSFQVSGTQEDIRLNTRELAPGMYLLRVQGARRQWQKSWRKH